VTLFLFVGICGLGGIASWGDQKPKDKLLFLVARPSILDPIFEHSVVLMLPITDQDEPLIVGLIINKPTRLPLSKVFPDSPAVKQHVGNAYMGGPVDIQSPALLFHAPKPPHNALRLYDDVYLSLDPDVISGLLEDSKQTGELRLFLGRSQWAPEQLQGEALRGSWYSLRAEGDVLFDHDYEHIWNRMHERARPPADVKNWMVLPAAELFRFSAATSLPFKM
jgi:putative transcriptional regulator